MEEALAVAPKAMPALIKSRLVWFIARNSTFCVEAFILIQEPENSPTWRNDDEACSAEFHNCQPADHIRWLRLWPSLLRRDVCRREACNDRRKAGSVYFQESPLLHSNRLQAGRRQSRPMDCRMGWRGRAGKSGIDQRYAASRRFSRHHGRSGTKRGRSPIENAKHPEAVR